jgi:diketogulonate reductase-like aldo/keto reductase
LREWLAKNPQFKRSDIFITSKVWPHLCGSPEDIEWSLNDSLRMLGTDYVDCFLVHWPIAAQRTEGHQPKKGADGKVRSRFTFLYIIPLDFVNFLPMTLMIL